MNTYSKTWGLSNFDRTLRTFLTEINISQKAGTIVSLQFAEVTENEVEVHNLATIRGRIYSRLHILESPAGTA